MQGGHNPDLPLAWYEDLFRAIKTRYPEVNLHALSPPEVIHISRLSQLPLPAGPRSAERRRARQHPRRRRRDPRRPRAQGAALLRQGDRRRMARRHAPRAPRRPAHDGDDDVRHVETDEERIEHLLRLRALQDETGGFTAFISWSYQPDHTELAGSAATGFEYLRTQAIARIVLDNFANMQSSWVTQGGKVGQLSLAFGANDMGSLMIEENVVRAAGAAYCMDEVEIVRNIEDAGFAAKRRNMHYDILGGPIFREREVPRMLELATAREDGDHCADARRAPLVSGAEPDRQAGEIAGWKDCRIAGRKVGRHVESPFSFPFCNPAIPPSCNVMIRYHASWILPISEPPIRDGWFAVDRGRVVALGAAGKRVLADGAEVVDLGDVAVMPGLVNAHTHLELSYLRDEVPPASQFVTWIRGVMKARRERPDPSGQEILDAVDAALREASPAAPRSSATSATRWSRSIRWRAAAWLRSSSTS